MSWLTNSRRRVFKINAITQKFKKSKSKGKTSQENGAVDMTEAQGNPLYKPKVGKLRNKKKASAAATEGIEMTSLAINTNNTDDVELSQSEEHDEQQLSRVQEILRETSPDESITYMVDPTSGYEYYVDPETGETEWKVQPEQPLPEEFSRETSPAGESESITYMVDPTSGNEYYVDPETGETEWKIQPAPLPRQSRVGGVLELGDLREYTVDEATGKEYYIDEATGDAKWREGTMW